MEEELDGVQEKLNTSIVKVRSVTDSISPCESWRCWSDSHGCVFSLMMRSYAWNAGLDPCNKPWYAAVSHWKFVIKSDAYYMFEHILHCNTLSLTRLRKTLTNPSVAARSLKPVLPRMRSDWRSRKLLLRKLNPLPRKPIKSKWHIKIQLYNSIFYLFYDENLCMKCGIRPLQ